MVFCVCLNVMLTVFPLPAFQDNYLWLITAHGHALIVDPGDAAPVEAALAAQALTLDAILVTHHHRDHTGGIRQLREATGCAVYAPAGIRDATHVVSGGERIAFNGLECEVSVLATPGHTKDHLAYYLANHLFCGDTLFAAGCGRLFEGTPAQMVESFARLLDQPDATLLYPAHEYTLANLAYARNVDPQNPALEARQRRDQATRDQSRPTLPTTLADERATNPFLRTASPAVARVIHDELGRAPLDEAEAFAVLRAHKDRWDASH
jgi:hydroxyacylglutathione hydrolase